MRRTTVFVTLVLCLLINSSANAQNSGKTVLTCYSKHFGTTTYVIDLDARTVTADNPGGRSETGATNGPSHGQYAIQKLTDEEISFQLAFGSRAINRYTGVLTSTWDDGKPGPSEQCQKQQKQF